MPQAHQHRTAQSARTNPQNKYACRLECDHASKQTDGVGESQHIPSSTYTARWVLKTNGKNRDLPDLPKYSTNHTRIQMMHPYTGYCGTLIQIIQKFRVRVWISHKTLRTSLYGYKCCTEHTDVQGAGNTRVNTRPRGRSSIWSRVFKSLRRCARDYARRRPHLQLWLSARGCARYCVALMGKNHWQYVRNTWFPDRTQKSQVSTISNRTQFHSYKVNCFDSKVSFVNTCP